MTAYKNRHNDVFTFTPDSEQNILWEGNFDFCRIGYPNDYTTAYNSYVADGGNLSFNDFKDAVHEYDKDKKEYTHAKHLNLVTSNKDVIDMVDPSGGPYIASGDNMGRVGDEFKGMIVKKFERTDTGYVIIIEK